jgi:hypothetical protein
MDVLQWLQEVGFAFTEKTINVAAASNNAALLQWLLEQDCPQDGMKLCVMAALCGHTNILFLLAEHGLRQHRSGLQHYCRLLVLMIS